MTLSDIKNRITFYTSTTSGASGQFNETQRLISINKAYDDIHVLILQSVDSIDFDDKNKTDFPILTTDLVANQQDYGLPSSAFKVKRLEATYDNIEWKRLIAFDNNEISDATDTTTIANDFNTDRPRYDMQSNSLFLYPIPTSNIIGGLKIWIDRNVTQFTSSDLTAGTAEPGFDKNFHDLIAMKASYDYLISKTDNFATADRLKNEIREMELRLAEHYGSKDRDTQMYWSAANVGTAEWD